MKKSKNPTCFILMDFAGLNEKQLSKVYKDLKKKYPEAFVLPMEEQEAIKCGMELDNFFCTIEKIIASKKTVAVQYKMRSGQIRNLVEVEI
jgi:hypothetical protein